MNLPKYFGNIQKGDALVVHLDDITGNKFMSFREQAVSKMKPLPKPHLRVSKKPFDRETLLIDAQLCAPVCLLR